MNKNAFNIFNALKIESNEVIHTRMLVAIASQNDDCRNLFFDMLAGKGDSQKINALRTVINKEQDSKKQYSNWIKTEHKLTERVGKNIRDRGRADIWLGNRAKPSYPRYRVIIENKIKARDQYRQLRRYFRYLTGENRVNAGLYYLCLKDDEKSLKGFKASIEKFNSETSKEDTICHIITYKCDIINWLNKILELDSLEPDFRMCVEQYLEILHQITK